MRTLLHRPVTKDAGSINDVEVDNDIAEIESVQELPRPAGKKALKEAKTGKQMDERRSVLFKMTETIEQVTSLWEKEAGKQSEAMEVEAISLAMSVLDKTSTAYKNLEVKLLRLIG